MCVDIFNVCSYFYFVLIFLMCVGISFVRAKLVKSHQLKFNMPAIFVVRADNYFICAVSFFSVVSLVSHRSLRLTTLIR